MKLQRSARIWVEKFCTRCRHGTETGHPARCIFGVSLRLESLEAHKGVEWSGDFVFPTFHRGLMPLAIRLPFLTAGGLDRAWESLKRRMANAYGLLNRLPVN